MPRFSFSVRVVAALALIVSFGVDARGAAPKAITFGSPLSVASEKRGFDLANIDPNCPACKDFGQFATGGWIAAHPIPADRSSYGIGTVVGDRNVKISREILEAASASSAPAGSDERKIGDLYAACMNEDAIEAAGTKPIESTLAQIDSLRDTAGISDVLAVFHGSGVGGFFGIGSQIDIKQPSRQIPGLYPGGLTLEQGYYTRQDERSKALRDALSAHIKKMFELLGDPAATASTEAASVLALETTLATAQLSIVERRNPDATYHLTTLADLKALAPHIAWDRYLAARAVPASIEFNVSQPRYIAAMDASLASAPLADVKAYLRWRVLNAAATELPKRFADQEFTFARNLTGAQQQLPRWQRCTAIVNATMGDALGRLWVARAFPPAARARAKQLVANLRAALRDDLQTLAWMTPATREEAQKKLAGFVDKIGYPDVWRDYASLNITRAGYFDDVRNGSRYLVAEGIKRIGQPIDRKRFGMTPPTVNAYYSAAENEIVFPAGILQPPYFDPGADDAINYGGIGAVIGHEMTHGFDDQGRRYDASGKLRDWWTAADAENFKERAQCIVNQFSSYTVVDDLKMNGQLVQGEAIADLGGITIAYHAFERAMQGKPHTKIDGYTPEQRFFLAYAQSWESTLRPERARSLVATDPHPMARFRVLGTLSNMPEFAAAFRCKAGDPMVRPVAERCRIW